MKVELTRFKVKEGKSHKVDEWMKLLHDRMGEVLLTLGDEKMHVETIFRECLNGEEFLYWYSVQGEGGSDVEDSEHDIDRLHIEYWEECIDSSYKHKDLKTEVVMIQENIKNVILEGS
ncbi:DUF6176 family protein [Pontibacillus yanchengensis]|uniref:NIPSNAP domain-containing protein n=1 Tax=Pontibacillus yanchengensis Y32 TaxID=1385514 RepID=A0A0A2TC89_9BACI|nr:DUF6176 family protein [Pontibacillus yanchengensis]KGP73417.1 hypothetical protein N782_05040 [Pontibacillus yanchengensis Y32]